MKFKLNSIPPNPECGLNSWFGNIDTASQKRDCVDIPGLGEAYYKLYPQSANATAATPAGLLNAGYSQLAVEKAQDLKAGRALVFPTKAFCCKPGTGAHAEGCSTK